MRQSIGGAWLFSISITLMMFIIAYVAISIDYSNAYQLKNDVVLYLEQYSGFNKDSAAKIVARMKARKYATMIDCSKGYDTSTYYEGGASGLGERYYYALSQTSFGSDKSVVRKNFSKGDTAVDTKKARGYLCIYKYQTAKHENEYGDGASQTKAFYVVATNFGFNFPILGNVFTYRVTGETSVINYPYEDADYRFNA